jgi:hypothetical protein
MPCRYAPRKPKYFNRIHTGYEWNKYNQTHYDTENPPPKVVQGYKFNIFYPELLDKTIAPTYRYVVGLAEAICEASCGGFPVCWQCQLHVGIVATTRVASPTRIKLGDVLAPLSLHTPTISSPSRAG